MIEHVGWAVQPQDGSKNRPTQLVGELERIGAISRNCTFSHHGTAPTSDSSVRASRLVPRLPGSAGETAVLSPVFNNLNIASANVKWFDAYDDWSIAPDINRLYRQYSRINYSRVRRSLDRRSLVTVNSDYMALKLGLPRSSVIANGVDSNLASITQHGDSKVRLVMLGHFFEGRTDYELIKQLVNVSNIDEIIVAGLGRRSKSADRIRGLLRASRSHYIEHEWLSLEGVGQLAGPRTVGVIPHVVSDYTVSQNLMKAFQFIALGLPVVVPMLLLPPQIDIRFSYLVGQGSGLDTTLVPWIKTVDRPDLKYRQEFVEKNSWKSRAEQIAERL